MDYEENEYSKNPKKGININVDIHKPIFCCSQCYMNFCNFMSFKRFRDAIS